MDIIESIYNLHCDARGDTKEYWRKSNELSRTLNGITDDNKKLAEIESLAMELAAYSEYEGFSDGFRLGFKLWEECLKCRV